MEIQGRKLKLIQNEDQENMHVIKGKAVTNTLSNKRHNINVRRGALGEINTNVQVQRNVGGKVAIAAAEIERKVSSKTNGSLSNYRNVQSKIDTGLVNKNVLARPPLRREESTASHAVRATIKAKLTANKENEKKLEFKKPTVVKSFKPKVQENSLVKKGQDSLARPVNTDLVSFEALTLESDDNDDEDNLSLPEDIEDVDAKSGNSPMLMSVYVRDIYNYLSNLEIKYPIEEDFLKKQVEITGKMRATLIDWLLEVDLQFSFFMETLQLTIGIIDRYLQATPNVQKNKFQLVGITAMFIAHKYEEIYPVELKEFVHITNNAYTKNEVLQCEREIMYKLGFCLARPIPLQFLRRFVKVANGTLMNHNLAKYFIDLCLVTYSMAHYKPSQLAAAATCLSLYLLSNKNLEDLWTPTLVYYSKYSFSQILPIMKQMALLAQKVEDSKFRAAYKKYKSSLFSRVSLLPQLKGSRINEFVKVVNC